MRTVLFIAMLLLHAAWADAQMPVSASISSNRAAVGEVFYFTLSANGSDIGEPDLRELQTAGIQLGAPSHQTSTSIRSINGATSVVQSRSWRYPVSASQEGTLTIPRVSLTVDGKEYFTQPMTMEITRSVDMGTRSPGANTELTVDDLAFVKAIADKTTVYQGEPVLLRLRLYTLDRNYISVEGPQTLPMPDTSGFFSGPQWRQSLSETISDNPYQITEFVQILYPAMPGEQIIGAWQWQGSVRWHDVRRRPQGAARMFSTQPISITVLPLPPAPDHFSGAVGKFRIKAQLAQQNLTQGTPVRFTITVSGEGNPNSVGAPDLPTLSWAHVSGPEVETHQQENTIEVTKVFSYLITPLETGEYTMPSVDFTFFAPVIQNYKTEKTQEFSVAVQPAAGGTGFVAIGGSAEEQRRKIEVFDSERMPVITDIQALETRSNNLRRKLKTSALCIPFFLMAGIVLLHFLLRQRRRLSQDHGFARRYYAKAHCLKTFEEVKTAEDPVETLYRGLATFVADMLNLEAAGLTASDVDALLQAHGAGEEARELTGRVLRACERARYAGRSSTQEEIAALLDAALSAVEKLHPSLEKSS